MAQPEAEDGLRPNLLGDNVSQPEPYEDDGRFEPELDLPVSQTSPDAAPARDRPRGPDGKFVPEKQQHSRAVVRLAESFGFTRERIDATTPEVLEELVLERNRWEREEARAARQILGSGIREAPAASERREATVEEEPDLTDVHEPIRKMFERQQKELAALKAERQAEKAEAGEREIDNAFKSLEDPELFGEGSAKEVGLESEEMERRRAVYARAARYPSGSLRERLAKARTALYPGRGEQTAKPGRGQDNSYSRNGNGASPELQRRRDEWDEGALAVPSHRKPSPRSPEQRAMAVAAEHLRNIDLGGDSRLDDEP